VALGTTRRGAAQPRLARRTGVAEGAVVRADATQRGDGGTIIVNSSELTIQAGTVSTRGGPSGGNGGFVEISGQSGFRLPGAVDVSAPAGQPGTILIDPEDLTIVTRADPRLNVTQADFIDGVLGAESGPADAFLSNDIINLVLTGNIRLEATRDIFVDAPLSGNPTPPGAGTLTLDAGRNIAVNDAISGFPDVNLIARTGGIALNGVIDTPGTLSMTAGAGGITQTARFRALRLEVSTTGSALLNFTPASTTAPSNELGTLGPSSVSGNFALRTTPYDFDATTLNIEGTVAVGGRLSLDHSAAIAQAAPSVIQAGELVVTTPASISLLGDNAVAAIAGMTAAGRIDVRNVQGTTITGAVTATQLGVQITAESGNLTVAAPVSGFGQVVLAAAGNLALTTAGSVSATPIGRNVIELIGGAAFTAGVPRTDTTTAGALDLAGNVSAPGGRVILGAGTGGIRQTAGGITTDRLSVTSGGVALLGSPANAVSALTQLSAAGDFVLDNGSADLSVQTGPITETAPGTAATIGLRTAGTVFLVADAALDAPGAGGRIALRAGRVAIDAGFAATAATLELAPFAAVPLTVPVATPTGTGFEITAADLAAFSGVQTLRLGGTTFDGVLTPSASSVSFVGPLAFAGTLDVRSTGNVAQNAGANLAVGTLTGAAGGNIVLANAGNAIGALGDLSAGGALTLRNGTALAIPAGRTVSAGGVLDIATLAGGLTVDGTVTGATTTLTAAGPLSVNGFSAIARSGDLTMTGQSFALNGLAAAAGNILVNAATTASLAGLAQTPNTLRIAAPTTSFGGLNARSAAVLLALGDTGSASGALDARGLTVQGGRRRRYAGLPI
ncbi:beta strand repeat-containing protein, partial [Falsiroseomonas oryziterrae]|uniref:beta strand repeat-containing protein n=1 Tax=Falsiroseomonas oryziterrae TaxID=2911368 RepID=UPI001F1C3DF7